LVELNHFTVPLGTSLSQIKYNRKIRAAKAQTSKRKPPEFDQGLPIKIDILRR
jgi:hypothetical protein